MEKLEEIAKVLKLIHPNDGNYGDDILRKELNEVIAHASKTCTESLKTKFESSGKCFEASFLKDIQQSRNSTQSLETSITEFRFLCALGGDLGIDEESLTVLQDTIEKIHYTLGRSMHRLHLHSPSKEVLANVIDFYPSILKFSHENDNCFPIHTAVLEEEAVKYIPILAGKAVGNHTFNEDSRGGLLLSHKVLTHPESQEESKNPLQVLCDEGDNDEERVKLLKELKKKHLLLKEDVKMHHLVFYSSHPGAKKRFHHLLSICPLLTAPYNATFKFGTSPYLIAASRTKEELKMVLAAGFKYYKDDYGFLFERDENGMIIFDYLCREIGENVVKEALEEVFSTIELPRNPNVEKSEVPEHVIWLDDLWEQYIIL